MYRATDEELGVAVAIKLLKRRMASDELAAAQVRDDNLVRVFGTGKLDSTAYIAMERLDGPTSSSTSANIRRSRPCTPRARALRRSWADHRRPRSRSTCRSRPSASRRIDTTRARWPRGKREQELVFMQMVSRPFANARSGACLLTESLCYWRRHIRGAMMKKGILQGMDDEQLLALFTAGEAAAGEVLLGRFRPTVLSFFMRRLPPVDADEQTQVVLEVLSKLPQRTESLRSTLRSFVFGVARMTLRGYCSRKANGRNFDPDVHSLVSLDPSLSSQMSELNRRSWLGTAIETLPLEAQMLLEMRYGQRLGYREIAAIYEEPEPTIRRRMQLLKSKLQIMRQRFEKKQ